MLDHLALDSAARQGGFDAPEVKVAPGDWQPRLGRLVNAGSNFHLYRHPEHDDSYYLENLAGCIGRKSGPPGRSSSVDVAAGGRDHERCPEGRASARRRIDHRHRYRAGVYDFVAPDRDGHLHVPARAGAARLLSVSRESEVDH